MTCRDYFWGPLSVKMRMQLEEGPDPLTDTQRIVWGEEHWSSCCPLGLAQACLSEALELLAYYQTQIGISEKSHWRSPSSHWKMLPDLRLCWFLTSQLC